MSFNSPLCKDAPVLRIHRQNVVESGMAYKVGSQTRHPLMPNKSQYRFGIELKDKGGGNEMDTSSLETKYRCVVKRDGVYGKTQYRALTKRYTPWQYTPALQRDIPLPPRRLDNDKQYHQLNLGYSRKP